MKAVVLVGGEGTRLRPLTLGTPKPMLPVAECTIIERVVGHLGQHGIDGVVLSLGYRPDAFVAAFPDDLCAGVPVTYAVEPSPLDTAGGIAFAARSAGLEQTGEPFVVVNGDVLTDLDLGALITFHRERCAEATIALTPVDDPSAFGVVPTRPDGAVEAFIEKPPAGTAPTNYINAGFYVLEPSVLARVPVGGRVNIEREVFPALVEAGTLFALGSDAYWTDTGTPALYLHANLDLVSGRRHGLPAPGAHERSPGEWTVGAAVIDGDLDAPVLVADAAFVAGGARVARSVVSAGARVERGAVVEGSVLLPGAVVHAGAHVRDSIIGDAAVIGRDAVVEGLTVVQGGAHVPDGARLDGARVGRDPVDA